MPTPTALLDIQIATAAWRKLPNLRGRLQMAAQATAEHLPKKLSFPFMATVLLTNDAQVRQLNRDFRGMDKPTNVLSFPQHEAAELPKIGKEGGAVELGDIALGLQYIVVEAKSEHKILIKHVTHLVIHGLLHLLGYDHIEDGQAETMEKLETRIMHALGLPDPYEALPDLGKKKMKKRTRSKK